MFFYKNAIYDQSSYRRLKDVIPDSFVDSLELEKQSRVRKYMNRRLHRRNYVRALFLDFLKLMMEDCIANNHKFCSPNREYFYIYIREKRPHEMKIIMSKISKVYTGVNLIKSNGKIYEFVLFCKSLMPKPYRKIRISHYMYKELVKQVNEGRRYSGVKTVKMKDFVPGLRKMYPDLTERQIKKTINIGCHNIFQMLAREEDIKISSGVKKVNFVIHRTGMKPAKKKDEKTAEKHAD